MNLKKLGPGLLFAGAAIGVSHLVQSTRAGADFGFGLLWALILVNLFKYPFFQFGPRYAAATGESLLDGYKKLGNWVLALYFVITLLTMFTIQTAVTIVTAGLASTLFGDFISIELWTVIILIICMFILLIGKYHILDKIIKIIIITLTLSTVVAVLAAVNGHNQQVSFVQMLPKNSVEIAFLIAFMGWMPAPLDISIWHSLWATEKKKEKGSFTPKEALFDFNVGYMATIVLGIGFIALGALVMFPTGETFSPKSSEFASQLINMYTNSLGNWAYVLIGIAAFTTMFSTTLTTLDASPRAMDRTIELLLKRNLNKGYLFWISILTLGTLLIFIFLANEMALLIKIATILSFLTAPIYALMNYLLIRSKHTPENWRPSSFMNVLSILGILFLVGFGVWYIIS